MILRCKGQAGFRKIRNKLRNVVGSPDISMSYNVITSKHDSERIAEAGTLFVGQQWFLETVNLGGGNWKCQTSDLMLWSKYKRKPEAWNKHEASYLWVRGYIIVCWNCSPLQADFLAAGAGLQHWVNDIWQFLQLFYKFNFLSFKKTEKLTFLEKMWLFLK